LRVEERCKDTGSGMAVVTPTGVTADGRLDSERAMVLVEQHWPEHEATQYKNRSREMVKAQPPLWRAKTLAQQRVPPSDASRAYASNRRPEADDAPFSVLQGAPSLELRHRTKGELFAPPFPDVLSGVMRLWKKGSPRTPLVWHTTECGSNSWHKMSDFDGEPCDSICALAAEMQCEVVQMRLTDPIHEAARQECLSKLNQCLDSGNWLLVVEKGTPCHQLYREIGRRLYCLDPDAERCPRREHFRLWIKVETAPDFVIDLNANVQPFFPDIFAQNVRLAMRSGSTVPASVQRNHPGRKKYKIVRRLARDTYGHPECANYYDWQVNKHSLRAGQGRDYDSESDDDFADNPDMPFSSAGSWFVRAGDRALANRLYSEFRPSDVDPPAPIEDRPRSDGKPILATPGQHAIVQPPP